MIKRLTAIFIAVLITFSASVPAFAEVNTNASVWAVSSMEYAYTHGLITEKELQIATSPMSREEFCSVIMHFLQAVTGIERKATQPSPFSDCDDPMVIAAYETGIISGVAPGLFAPEKTLTREQMAIMIARTLKVCSFDLEDGAKEHPFTDTEMLYQSSNDYIDELYGVGIINGYDDGTFQPFGEMTVEEAIISFVRAYRYIMTGDAEGNQPLPGEEPPVVVEQPQPEEPQEVEIEEPEDMDTVFLNEDAIVLGMTTSELKRMWGEPDRIDESIYGLERYIYINDYEQYFFVTILDGRVEEIFVPGTAFTYIGIDGNKAIAEVGMLDYVSAVEHSGIIVRDELEARLLFDYEGYICGILLQTKDFIEKAEMKSSIADSLREDMAAQLLDLIQVCREAEGSQPLVWDKFLWDVAFAHTKEMIYREYFDYTGWNGSTPFERMAERGIEFDTASETIARQRGEVVQIYQEWMRNASKINALIDPTMQEVGIGVQSSTKILYVTVDLCGKGLKK